MKDGKLTIIEESKDKKADENAIIKSKTPKKQGELDKFKLKIECNDKPILKNINIDMKLGDLLVVVG